MEKTLEQKVNEVLEEVEQEYGQIDAGGLPNDSEVSDPLLDDDEDEALDPDTELAAQTIEKIHSLFDGGCTRSGIAKELSISRADVIEVLSKYVTRNKINGKNTQKVDFVFDGSKRKRIELGDRLNTSIYVPLNATKAEINAIKKRWNKVINN